VHTGPHARAPTPGTAVTDGRDARVWSGVVERKRPPVALARAMLFDPHRPWHAAAELGATVDAPPQYLRSAPADRPGLFGNR
jgi:hypothetical protein